jgi:flagellin FlaB
MYILAFMVIVDLVFGKVGYRVGPIGFGPVKGPVFQKASYPPEKGVFNECDAQNIIPQDSGYLAQIKEKAKMKFGKALKTFVKQKRGIVGIEAAIVLIAFVVIAAAMAYVVINMGFYSSQKAKSTIDRGLQEATAALELDGFLVGLTDNNGKVQYLAIPLKLAVGQDEVDTAANTTLVAALGTTFSLSNIYSGAATTSEANLTKLMTDTTPYPNATCYIFNGDSDTALEQNEKAYLVVNLGPNYTLSSYDKLKIEIRPARGAALMIQREVPGGLAANTIIDFG